MSPSQPSSASVSASNHYTTLGLRQEATVEDIQAAYNRKLRRLRRKLENGDPNVPPPEYMDGLRIAWQTLRDPEQRHRYDKKLQREQAQLNSTLSALTQQVQGDPVAAQAPLSVSLAPPPLFPGHVSSSSQGQDCQFQFVGQGGEYFRIWIVNLLLSILTLGIYSAWAKVRREQYFHRNLLLEDSGFDYHGTAKTILRGRAVAFVIFSVVSAAQHTSPLLYAGAMLLLIPIAPWLIVRAFRFRAANTSYRGLRFSFDGTYRQALTTFVGYGLLSFLSFGLLFPRFYREQRRFVLNNLRYGSASFSCDFSVAASYKLFLLPMLVGLLFPVAIGAFFMLEKPSPLMIFTILPLAFLGFVLLQVLLFAYVQAGMLNLVWNGTSVSDHHFICTVTNNGYLGLTFMNWLLTVLTAGLYWPWAKVRMAQYRAANLLLAVQGSLDQFVAGEAQQAGALGDATADMFDFDIAF